MERWAEYVEELNKDESRKKAGMSDLVNAVSTFSREEIQIVIKELPTEMASGVDNICVELLQFMDEKICYNAWARREWR